MTAKQAIKLMKALRENDWRKLFMGNLHNELEWLNFVSENAQNGENHIVLRLTTSDGEDKWYLWVRYHIAIEGPEIAIEVEDIQVPLPEQTDTYLTRPDDLAGLPTYEC